jgi:hypothetical protein
MTEIYGGMIIELLLYLKWTEVYIQSRARDPPQYTVIRSLRVTRILDVFKIVDPGRTVIRLMWFGGADIVCSKVIQALIQASILTPKLLNNNLSKVSQAAYKQNSSLC